jgi:enterobactin synthetase component D
MQLLSSKAILKTLSLPLTKDILSEIDTLKIIVPEQLQNATKKRKLEYLAGRYIATKLLIESGYQGEIIIGMDSDRSPIWPDGWIGSISHTKNLVSAAVASKKHLLGLGIDSEIIMTSNRSEQVWKRVLTGSELSKELTPEWITLVFSAKESIYKCIRPLCGQFFGFSDAEIIHVDYEKETFRFELKNHIGGNFNQGWQGTGVFEMNNQIIHTAVELSALA